MPERTLRMANEAFPDVRFLQTYGLSELGILRSKSESDASLRVRIGGEDYETRVVNGRLLIRARSSMLGYLNAPSPFDEDGWFDTGDSVIEEDGYLRILGRESDIINVGGQKVYPAEVEQVIAEMSGVIDVDRIEAANFVKKRAAPFVWGPDQAPWTFTFATPRTAPWVYDHAYQVTRAEYDQILLNAAREQGTDVREEHEVVDIRAGDDGDPVRVGWRNNGLSGALEGDFVIDASGSRGIVARKLGLRRYDPYFQNLAVWSYFSGGKRFGGDLEGNIFSVTFQEGWIWIIPLKDDIYSVGVVSDKTSSTRMREIGIEAFYRECLDMCPLAREILEAAVRCDKVRVIRDWAYDASSVAMERAFLCGDSACFIDPLFSQGVHLATYSAMLAAADIDHLYRHPRDAEEIRTWYERS